MDIKTDISVQPVDEMENGAQSHQILPEYFTNESLEVRTRMGILQFEGIKNEQRKEIFCFCRF